jgi:hypothetical protein
LHLHTQAVGQRRIADLLAMPGVADFELEIPQAGDLAGVVDLA